MLTENIPDDISLHVDGRHHIPLSVGFQSLLEQAKLSVEVVSSVWDLNAWDLEPTPGTAAQVRVALHKTKQTVIFKRPNWADAIIFFN